MEHQSSVKAKKKISFEAFKTFSHRLVLRSGCESEMDMIFMDLWRIIAFLIDLQKLKFMGFYNGLKKFKLIN
jgi:hypothetical protein